MPPGHVKTLDEYWVWLEWLIDCSGGALEADGLIVALLPPDARTPAQWEVAILSKQELRYPDGSHLDFALVVDSDLELRYYTNHYSRGDGSQVWRIDNHGGHEDECGGVQTHAHLGPANEIRRYPYVELDHVLDAVRKDQDLGDCSLGFIG